MKGKLIKHGILVVLLLAFIAVGIRSITQTNNRIQLKDIQLQDKSAELKELQLEYQTLNVKLDTELHQKNINQDKAEQLQKERDELQQKLEQTERELQARQEAKRIATQRTEDAAKRVLGVRTAYVASGGSNGSEGCGWLESKLIEHGVSGADIQAAIYIATKESGCRSTATNPTSGACNFFQEYPCGKWGGVSNVDTHIRGAIAYSSSRYGGWQGAYSFWIANHYW